VTANNIPFQTIHSIAALQAHDKFYFFPYRHVTRQSLGNVLLIGAGTGNDVAVALAHGARHIDAVEIDPALPAIGRRCTRSTRTRPRGSPSTSPTAASSCRTRPSTTT
jgi:Spermidine synthase